MEFVLALTFGISLCVTAWLIAWCVTHGNGSRALGALALVILLLLCYSFAAHADEPTVFDCVQIAKKYVHDPFSLTMADLDELRTCASDEMNRRQSVQEDKRIDKAINDLYGDGK